MGDFPFVEWLAREYKKRAEISDLWTDYVKAHGLANFCVAKHCRESRHLVYEIEDSWYNGRHPLSFKEHQQLIGLHKYKLKSYRDETSLNYKQLEAEVAKLNLFEVFDETNLSIAKSLSKQIFKVSKKCSEGLRTVSEDIIKSSELLLQCIGLTAPCNFAVIGLGSIAKGEATPYSDLEYGFIVEREDTEYFEKLAVDSYFRIGNLCETPLKTFDIAELKVPKGCPPIIAENIPAGYRIDGLTKNAGNIPTGNGREGSKTLTLTVDKLMELYKTSAVAPFVGLADLSDMLSSTVVIYTNEGETSQLRRDFVLARTAFEETKDETKTAVNKKKFQSFSSDINSYTFLPEFIKFQPPGNLNIKVKTDIFRYPTLLANNIKMLMGWNLQYSWQVFSTLRDQRILSKENYRYINIVLAFSIYLRTSTYLNQRSPAEFLSISKATNTSDLPLCTSIFVNLGSFLIPIKQSVIKSVENLTANKNSVNSVAASIFESLDFNTQDFLQKVEIFYFVGCHGFAKSELTEGLGKDVTSMPCDQFIKLITKKYNGTKPAGKYVELCAYLLYYNNCHNSAISYFEWLISNKNENLGLLKLLTAQCKQEVGNFQGIEALLTEAKTHLKEESRECYEADIDHDDVWTTYTHIGILYNAMGEYRESLEYFDKALRVNINLCGDAKNRNTAATYNNIGNVHKDHGDIQQSLEYLTKSLEMKKEIYGATANNPDLASSYSNIGIAYKDLRKNTLALEYHTKSLNMRKEIHGFTANHPDIAASYTNIGNVYCEDKKFSLALKYHTKSLAMNESIYGTTADHPSIAGSYFNIGRAYNEMEDNTSALHYLSKALNMRIAIFGANRNNPAIFESYFMIAKVWYQLDNYVSSIDYCTKALDMGKALHGSTKNHQIIEECNKLKDKAYAKLCPLQHS